MAKLGAGKIILLALVVFFLVAYGIDSLQNNSPEVKARVAADEKRWQFEQDSVMTLRQRMRDPDSLRIDQAIVVGSSLICYDFHAKNGFGGENSSRAIQFGPLLAVRNELDDGGDRDFAALWNERCAQQVGEEKSSDLNVALSEYAKLHND